MLSEREQADILLEGRANAYTVDSETKLQSQLNQFKKLLTDGEQTRQEKFASMNSEVNDLVTLFRKEYTEKF